MQIIPFSGYPQERLRVTIEGRSLILDLSFASVVDSWFLDILESIEGTAIPLLLGIRVTVGSDMLASYALGIGGLFVIDRDRTGNAPGKDDLGDRYRIAHVSSQEIAAGVIVS